MNFPMFANCKRCFTVVLALVLSIKCLSAPLADPSDLFGGLIHRPKLEILHPDNGQVLDTGDLEIRIAVNGYDTRTHFHDTSVCVALSTGDSQAEQCFEDNNDITFHANGLTAGQHYSLRIVLYERRSAIAVSVRSFRVAGITARSLDTASEGMVTIQTAMQVAIGYQTMGMEMQAEEIYRSILFESPAHPDALHLLGVIHYQKGEAAVAVDYIELALRGNKSYEGFHNSLGECYRILGRLDEAASQFNLALALNPGFFSATFNLGLVLQQQNRWEEAIGQYQKIAVHTLSLAAGRRDNNSEMSENKSGEATRPYLSAAESHLAEEAKVRECDLLQALGSVHAAMVCWRTGTQHYPTNHIFFNELGNVFSQSGLYETALPLYQTSAALGSYVADLNAAHMLELQGFATESRATFEGCLARAELGGLSTFHIRIRITTSMPRIVPARVEDLIGLRSKMEKELDALLAETMHEHLIDNSSPLKYGYWIGQHLAFHGLNSVELKRKMYRVYLKVCPALKSAYFLDQFDDPMAHRELSESRSVGRIQPRLLVGKSARAGDNSAVSAASHDSGDRAGRIRIGFVSRFMKFGHASGELVQGVVRQLALAGYEIFIFFIDDVSSEQGQEGQQPDSVRALITRSAHTVYSLPLDIAQSAVIIRAYTLDVLIYPDVGIEPMSYFLPFARLAPVQAAWLGHPDTTGLAPIDHYISSDVEIDNADMHYSEKLVRFQGLGISLVDSAPLQPIDEGSPLFEQLRSNIADQLGLPRAGHIYVVISHLSGLHSRFDEALSRILLIDKLGYLVIVDSGIERKTLQDLFVSRMAGTLSEDVRSRIVFLSGVGPTEMLGVIAASHVVLDPFPSGTHSFVGSLHALSLCIPVVTFPSTHVAGRLTLDLYKKLQYASSGLSGLVVDSVSAYVSRALSIVHQPALRKGYVAKLRELRGRLFPPLLGTDGEPSHETRALQDQWGRFIHDALSNSRPSSSSSLPYEF